MAKRRELVLAMGEKYHKVSRKDKGRILDECCSITGYHRKHLTRLLRQLPPSVDAKVQSRQKIYGEAVLEALIVIWEAADRICGKRLKAVLDDYVESMEKNGHLDLAPEVRLLLQRISASTIDRILSPVRAQIKSKRKRRKPASSSIKQQVPVRTFGDWNDPDPGYFEADLVCHMGGKIGGSCVHTLTLTDINSGWTECRALLVREQTLITEAVDAIRSQLPFEMLGLDTDNDSVFLNETVITYCRNQKLEFTRSRAYRKNDQAWVEQKNGDVVRRFTGYKRFEGLEAARLLMGLYEPVRLYVNFFQPSFKLIEKIREGAKVWKRYAPPATPCNRLLSSPLLSEEVKQRLRQQRARLDPVKLLHSIRETQRALAAPETQVEEGDSTESSQSLDEFLAQLSYLWKQGEARPTHRSKPAAPHWWRTRVDPFEDVWPQVLEWLEDRPDITAKDIFVRLCLEHPEQYTPGQLRTLQRRIREWRREMAHQLVYASSEMTYPSVPV